MNISQSQFNPLFVTEIYRSEELSRKIEEAKVAKAKEERKFIKRSSTTLQDIMSRALKASQDSLVLSESLTKV